MSEIFDAHADLIATRKERDAALAELAKLRTRARLMDETLDAINAVMWNSFCIKRPIPGDKIMDLLNKWAGGA